MIQQTAKPMGSNWTDEQWQAITLQGGDILVAAAAGSGKTAVLVERIIRRISDEAHPLDVDRLLVATFTKASAAEMRLRIGAALEKALFANPDSHHLRRQLALIHRASITTLHSFCMEVIQRYYTIVQLDPNFRIANETEAALMRQDTLDELLEECYRVIGNDSRLEWSNFELLFDWFSGEKSDNQLVALIEKLYVVSRSHPMPNKWLNEQVIRFAANNQTDDHAPRGTMTDLWFQSLLQDVQLELNGVVGLLNEAIRIAGMPEGPAPYSANLHADLSMIKYLLEKKEQSWNHLYEAFQLTNFEKLNPCKGENYSKNLQEQVKQLREQAKTQFKKLKEQLFGRDPAVFQVEMAEMAPLLGTLVDLVTRFGEKYKQAKMDRGLLDFADLEHYCLQILTDEHSTAAQDYQEQFVEILLDEYQDTNRVQEEIIRLISRNNPGNRFMVGDVKQSIYRFRLAEPELFMEKYGEYSSSEGGVGRRIDLAQNFRSRKQVVAGVNYLFQQIMNAAVAEVPYDSEAELVYGADYPEDEQPCDIELHLIDGDVEQLADEDDEEITATDESDTAEAPELKTVQLEARLIVAQIRQLMGLEACSALQVYDKKLKQMRPIAYHDIVILLRATHEWSQVLLEQLQQQGIPVYADLNTGYFTAMEIEIVLSLLQLIDNPYQDIPLASVLRSPMYHLTADDLAQIRLAQRQGRFFEALLTYAAQDDGLQAQSLRGKINLFMAQLEKWREAARQGALADLIWEIYRQTGFYDFVGGMPGGKQRQANLHALYERARQYEATSYRGLYRFLRFIERMQQKGDDLGTARSLGEQEDVVRIMSIHRSKGLEFPVVIVAGLAKKFNQSDLNGSFLLHKELGFGPKFVNSKLRISYPSLPNLAIKKKLRLEMLAEEMRVLYVALTRAREKLILIGSIKSLAEQSLRWSRQLENKEIQLPDYELVRAQCYMDWLGPAIIRLPQAKVVRDKAGLATIEFPHHGVSAWKIIIVRPDTLSATVAVTKQMGNDSEANFTAVHNMQVIKQNEPINVAESIEARLSWQYPYAMASQLPSKTSVTELKRQKDILLNTSMDGYASETPIMSFHSGNKQISFSRPKFMEHQQIDSAERGTIYHAVMQHLPLRPDLNIADIKTTIEWMQSERLLTASQSLVIDTSLIARFFASGIGHRMLQAKRVYRETPFSFGLRAEEIYPQSVNDPTAKDMVLIQGVIDCLFEDEHGLVLLDYKTDQTVGADIQQLKNRYKMQLDLYARAVEEIWHNCVHEKYLFYFDGAHLIQC